MDTQVRTPQDVFMQPQKLVVPLFQRPYVWNEENQWEPLWNDVVRLVERVLNRPSEKHNPHFLGAVVLLGWFVGCSSAPRQRVTAKSSLSLLRL
jgi:uncharacterized protein with ParB-like and HNH nuclease domain